MGRLVTCSRRERNSFCYIVFNTTQTTDASMKETTTLYSLHQGPPHFNHPALLCSPQKLAVMPCQDSLILYYSVPCAAIAVVCLVSNPALQEEWGGRGFCFGGGSGLKNIMTLVAIVLHALIHCAQRYLPYFLCLLLHKGLTRHCMFCDVLLCFCETLS